MTHFYRLVVLILSNLPVILLAQTEEKGLVGEWLFWPNYTLGGKAQNFSGPGIKSPQTPVSPVATLFPSILLHGKQPTERVYGFIKEDKLPGKSFSIELWLVNHGINRLVHWQRYVQPKNRCGAWVITMAIYIF